MKKTLISTLAAVALAAPCIMADVIIKLPNVGLPNKISVERTLISDWASAQNRAQRKTVRFEVPLEGNSVRFDLDSVGPAFYKVTLIPQNVISFFAAPDENISFNVTSLNPTNYTAEGSAILSGLKEVEAITAPIEEKYQMLATAEKADEKAMEEVVNEYNKTINDYIASNPEAPVVPMLLLNLNGEDFLKAYDLLTPEAKKSYLMPLVDSQKKSVEQRVEQQRQQEQMSAGHVAAPLFTLKDTEGKDVSLTDFRGKWVILDFWGTWCPWCIKGFPKLKETYAEYKDRLEIIGIDCNDSEAVWKDGVKRHELPWVNVYNPSSGSAILQQYQVQGFPTKVLIDPEGKIAAIATGEDPNFYTTIRNLIK